MKMDELPVTHPDHRPWPWWPSAANERRARLEAQAAAAGVSA